MVALLMALVLAGPLQALEQVPTTAGSAVVLEDPSAFGQTLAAFCAHGRQRTLGTLLARLRERSRREFGIDVLEPGALLALGLEARGPITILLPTPAAPILVLPTTAGDRFEQGLAAGLGGKYARTSVHDLALSGQTLRALTVGDVVTPRLYWATAGGRTYLGGARSQEALARLLAAPPQDTMGAQPPIQAAMKLLGAHPVVWAHHAPPARGGGWQVGGLTVTEDRLLGQHTLPDPSFASSLCRASEPHASATAATLAEALAPDALVVGSSPSMQALLALSPEGTDEAQLRALGGAVLADRLRRLLTAAPAIQQALGALDAPCAGAIFPRAPAAVGSSSLRQLVDGTFVARAVTAPDRARLAALAKRLASATGKSVAGAPTLKPWPKPITWQGKSVRPVHVTTPAASFDVAVANDTLIVASGTDVLPRVAQALQRGATPNAALAPSGTGPHADVRLHLDALAHLGEAAILAGAKGPLAQTPLSAMPELLLLGPTGDLLRELGALGQLDLRIGCGKQDLLLDARIALAAP